MLRILRERVGTTFGQEAAQMVIPRFVRNITWIAGEDKAERVKATFVLLLKGTPQWTASRDFTNEEGVVVEVPADLVQADLLQVIASPAPTTTKNMIMANRLFVGWAPDSVRPSKVYSTVPPLSKIVEALMMTARCNIKKLTGKKV